MAPSRFFGLLIDPTSLGGKTMVLLLAVLLGGLIGLEREWRGQAAGLRTHILVCVGATLMTLTSVEIGNGGTGTARRGPGRMEAQNAGSDRFLGAGGDSLLGMSHRLLGAIGYTRTTAADAAQAVQQPPPGVH